MGFASKSTSFSMNKVKSSGIKKMDFSTSSVQEYEEIDYNISYDDYTFEDNNVYDNDFYLDNFNDNSFSYSILNGFKDSNGSLKDSFSKTAAEIASMVNTNLDMNLSDTFKLVNGIATSNIASLNMNLSESHLNSLGPFAPVHVEYNPNSLVAREILSFLASSNSKTSSRGICIIPKNNFLLSIGAGTSSQIGGIDVQTAESHPVYESVVDSRLNSINKIYIEMVNGDVGKLSKSSLTRINLTPDASLTTAFVSKNGVRAKVQRLIAAITADSFEIDEIREAEMLEMEIKNAFTKVGLNINPTAVASSFGEAMSNLARSSSGNFSFSTNEVDSTVSRSTNLLGKSHVCVEDFAYHLIHPKAVDDIELHEATLIV